MRPLAFLVALCVVGTGLAVLPAPHAAAQGKDWTVLVYMDGDNNLEAAAINDFLEMSTVGSTSEVNVVVEFDRSPQSNALLGYSDAYGDWSTVKRFYVTAGMMPDPASALPPDLGELNMADPANLVDFVDWGMARYPAEHYFVVLWDHGLGWEGVVVDESAPGDRLTASELRSAVGTIVADNHRHIDLLGNDACRMTFEIMYELSDYVDYFVGSEKDEPIAGWPYDTFLDALTKTPTMTPAEVASALVDRYVDSYVNNSQYSVGLTAVNAASLRVFAQDFSAFVGELMAHEPYFTDQVLAARTATERYEETGQDYDLVDFVDNVLARIPSPRLERRAEAMNASFAAAVVHERHWDNPTPINGVHAAHAHGLSLYFPSIAGDPEYANLTLSRDTLWNEFLNTYAFGTRPSVRLTLDASTVDENRDGLRERLVANYTAGALGTVSLDVYRDGAYVLSRDYGAEPNQTAEVRLTFLLGGEYAATAYLFQGGHLQNLTTAGGLAIEQRVTFRGQVSGRGGAPLDGATVTLTNLRTDQAATGTTRDGGNYAISVVCPTWFRVGDPLLLSVSTGDLSTTLTFNATVPADGTVSQDLWLDTVGLGPFYLAIAGLAILAAVGIAYAVYYRRRLRREGERPAP